MRDTVTYAIPRCIDCPPLRQQPAKSVITGRCHRCGGPVGTGVQAVRELAARHLLRRGSNQKEHSGG